MRQSTWAFFLFLFAIAITAVACEGTRRENYRTDGYNTVRIDGCEYLSGHYQLAHLGTCDNPVHKCECEQ